MTESAEQRVLAQWLDFVGLLWCHIPNGGQRHVLVGRRLKSEGVKPGVPDILIFAPPPKLPGKVGVAIELKAAKGRLTDDQARWLALLDKHGWVAEACWGASRAIRFLEEEMGYGRR